MKKNVFICHRPYHILRSCDIIKNEKDPEEINILINFDVKLAGHELYQDFTSNNIFYSTFNEVVNMTRLKPPTLKSIFSFINYVKDRNNNYLPIVKKHSDLNNLYFFCDNETEIEIIVSMFSERSHTLEKKILVDEGMATYCKGNHSKPSNKSVLLSKIVTRLSGLKCFNYTGRYGDSQLYNYSLANNPEKAFFHHPIEKMHALNDDICEYYRSKLGKYDTISNDNYYFIYVSTNITEDIPLETEIKVMRDIQLRLKELSIDFYIKLHPQQNESAYFDNFDKKTFIEKGLPIELFFTKRSIIGGVGSSCLFNASLLLYHAVDVSSILGVTSQGLTNNYDWIEISAVKNMDDFIILMNTIINGDYENRNNNTICKC